jgi:hypothetical protein
VRAGIHDDDRRTGELYVLGQLVDVVTDRDDLAS